MTPDVYETESLPLSSERRMMRVPGSEVSATGNWSLPVNAYEDAVAVKKLNAFLDAMMFPLL